MTSPVEIDQVCHNIIKKGGLRLTNMRGASQIYKVDITIEIA